MIIEIMFIEKRIEKALAIPHEQLGAEKLNDDILPFCINI